MQQVRVEAAAVERRAPVQPDPAHGQQQDPEHARPHPFPALARADGRRQFAPAEGTAAKVGRYIGHPNQAQHGKQEVDSDRASLRQGEPGCPQRQHAQTPTRPLGPLGPCLGSGAQGHHSGRQPECGSGPPARGRTLLRPTLGDGPEAQCCQGSAHDPGERLGSLVQAAPFPASGCDQDQGQHGERPGCLCRQGQKQQRNENNGRDDTLQEHARYVPFGTTWFGRRPPKRRSRCANAASAASISASPKSGQRHSVKNSSE